MKIINGKRIECKELKCLRCGGTVVAEDSIDIDYSLDGEYVICTITGSCKKCDTEHEWREYYEFIGTTELEMEE